MNHEPTRASSTGRIDIVRMPGEAGPVLRCSGELSVSTQEALRRELDLLIPLGYRSLTLNLNGCTYLDLDGILGIVEAFKRLHENGRPLVVVAGRGAFAELVHSLDLDWILPTFPTEAAAARALRGCAPHVAVTADWEQARRETIRVWEQAYQSLGDGARSEAMAAAAGFDPLCSRAEELFQIQLQSEGSRCRLCPLFHALGGRGADTGCQSVRRPLLDALAAGEREPARRLMSRFIELMRQMPVPAVAAGTD